MPIESKALKPLTARGEATRNKLLAISLKLFAKQGYAQTGVSDITRKAGVAQGTFYLYFTDKKTVLRELVRNLSHDLRHVVAEATAGESSRRAKEIAGFRAFVRFAEQHPELYPVVMESQFVDPEIYREYYDSVRKGYIKALTAAQKAGEIRAVDPALAAYVLMGLGHFLGLDALFWRTSNLSDQSLEEAVDIVMRGLSTENDR
jgi:AcrR family transcriptional regulator